jgi:polysaccharide biosynthesis protein PslH
VQSPKINITQVCWYKVLPAHTGGQKGIVGLFKALSNIALVHFVCSNNNEAENSTVLPILPTSKWQFLQSKNYKKIIDNVKLHKSDFVIIEHPYYYLLHKWRAKYNLKLVVHTHNIEYKRLQKIGKWYWPIVYFVEKKALQKADFILFKTNEDAAYFAQHWNIPLPKIHILPYGITPTHLATKMHLRQQISELHNININADWYLFAASFDYMPNQNALLHLLHNIWPQIVNNNSNARLIICGNDVDNFLQKIKIEIPSNVTIAGFVQDVNEYMKAADVFINTVQIGEGVQTKCIEALAQHCSVVMYNAVANGMPNYLLSQKLFLANTDDEFIQLSQKGLVTKNNETAPQFFEEYNWDNIANALLHKLSSKG